MLQLVVKHVVPLLSLLAGLTALAVVAQITGV